MTITAALTAVHKMYRWISSERRAYLQLWEKTDDKEMHRYYGEKASTYTSIKLYMEKYMTDLIK